MNEKLNEVQKSLQENLTDQQKEGAKKCEDRDALANDTAMGGVEIPDDLAALSAGGVQAGEFLDYRKMRHEQIQEYLRSHQKKEYL